MRYHLIPSRVATIKKPEKCWQGCEENGTVMHRWWECKVVQPWWKQYPREIKDSIITHPEVLKVGSQRDNRTPHSQHIIHSRGEQLQRPSVGE